MRLARRRKLTEKSHALVAAANFALILLALAGCRHNQGAGENQMPPPEVGVVTIVPDTGRNYLSTYFDDAWRAKRGV